MENLKPFIICPITRQIMFDPVQLSGDKQTYEREAITQHLATSNKSPVTNAKLGSDIRLEVNGAIHSLITNYLAQHPEEYENDNVYFPEATMWNAIENNDVETVVKLFRVDKRFLSEKNAKGFTAFQQLCQTGKEATLQKIIDQLTASQKQQLVTLQPPKNWQPHILDALLLSAVKAGDDKVARFCLELGARINNQVHQTVSFVPTSLNYLSIPGDGHCLYHAVALYTHSGDQHILRQVVSARLEYDLDKFRGCITLPSDQTMEEYLQATREGREWADHIEIEVLMQVLDRPILVISDKGIRNQDDLERFNGEPIFVYYNGHNHYDGLLRKEGYMTEEVLEHLTQLNKNSREEDRHFTALHYAIEHHHAKIVELLIEHGADLAIKAQDGSTPLHTASLYNNDHALEQLLKFKPRINVNIKSDNGNTPLHVALIHGHKAIALLLMQAGADLDIKNNEQQTPYDIANTEMRTWFMAQKKQLKAEKAQAVWNTLHEQAQTIVTLEQHIHGLQNLQVKQALQINQLNAEIQMDEHQLKSLTKQIKQVTDELNRQQKTFNQLDDSLQLSIEATANEVPSSEQRLTQSVPNFFKPVQQINNHLAQGIENKVTLAISSNSV